MRRALPILLALVLLAGALNAQQQPQARGIDRLEKLYRRALKIAESGTPLSQNQQLRELVNYGTPAIRFVLLTKLDARGRGESAMLDELLLSDTAVTAPLMLERLSKETRPGPRARLARLLGLAGEPLARDLILRMLATDEEPETLAAAVEALGRIGRVDDAAKIEPLLKHEDELVRRGAIQTLGALKSPSSLPLLIDKLAEGTFQTRFAAVEAVAAYGEQATPPLLKLANELLGVGVADGDETTVESPPSTLLEGMDESHKSRLRGTLYVTLARIAIALDKGTVIGLSDYDPEAKENAPLESLGPAERLLELLKALHGLEPEPLNRRLLLDTLYRFGHGHCLNAVLEMQESETDARMKVFEIVDVPTSAQ